MKKVVYLLPVHREMIKCSMRFFRSQKKEKNSQFNLTIYKVNTLIMRNELSAMDLIYITQALRTYSKFLSKRNPAAAKHYRQQTDRIEKIRMESFQSYKKETKKEAASAPTLTA